MLPTFAAICRMEETGEIVRAGELVFEKVCCFIEKYEELVPPYIHVNLSCCQMRDIKNADSMIAIAKLHGVNPSRINLEITETTDCGEEGVLFVHKLLAEGFTFSLDDFGSCNSNCDRLLLYPVKVIKTSKHFINDAIQDKKAETILNGVFHIAKSIHCEPVVEGIEDASQINREFLLGVRYFQGNAFAKAMPEQEYVQFLLNHRQAETRRGPKS